MVSTADNHSVPAVASGFLFQLERALYHLAAARSDCAVGVETDDDVAVRMGNVLLRSEQDKVSYAPTGHPFQDSSKGLWNTLQIWLTGHDHGLVVERYCAVTSRPVPQGSLIARMAAATDDDAADVCIGDLRRIGATITGDVREIVDKVCSVDDARLRDVVLRTELQDASTGGQPADSRRWTIAAVGVPAGVSADAATDQLLGWVAHVLQEKWSKRQPGWIDRQAFVNQRQRVIDGLQRERVLERARQLVPVAAAQLQAASSREFVNRLIEIEVDSRLIAEAVEDLLKFEAEFVRLLQEGEVSLGDWNAMFDEMERRWRHVMGRIIRMRQASTDIEIGQEVLDHTIDPDFRPILRDMKTTHGYFAAGGYHRLADELRVGWHPRHQS